jgi:hypothetical protein
MVGQVDNLRRIGNPPRLFTKLKRPITKHQCQTNLIYLIA